MIFHWVATFGWHLAPGTVANRGRTRWPHLTETPDSFSLNWTLLNASCMRGELARYDLEPPDWLSESEDLFYFATTDDAPVAFLSFSKLHQGRPVAKMCGMNRDVLERSKNVHTIWREFEVAFGCIPVFDSDTKYFCNDVSPE